MICDRCQADMVEVENHFPVCTVCGQRSFSLETFAEINRVFQAYTLAKDECFPDQVPSYREFMTKAVRVGR